MTSEVLLIGKTNIAVNDKYNYDQKYKLMYFRS